MLDKNPVLCNHEFNQITAIQKRRIGILPWNFGVINPYPAGRLHRFQERVCFLLLLVLINIVILLGFVNFL